MRAGWARWVIGAAVLFAGTLAGTEWVVAAEPPEADLAVSQSANPVSVTVTVQNTGPDPASSATLAVVLQDGSPSGITAPTGALCQPVGVTGRAFACALGEIEASGTRVVTFEHQATCEGGDSVATVGSDTTDPDPADNESTIGVA